ncbi:WD repeat-containing protein 74 [Paramecium bursaria]
MQIISGDENGILKIIELEKQNVLLSKPILEGENNKLISMKDNKIKNNIIILSQKQLTIINYEFQILEQHDLKEPNALDFVIESGQIQKFTLFYQNFQIAHFQYDVKMKPLKVQQLNENKKIKLNKIIQLDDSKVLLVFQGQPPNIYDLKTQSITWKARNVANDIYDLQVKMDDFDGIKLDDYSIGVVTMHNTIRVYDITKPNQRPLFEYKIKEVEKNTKLDQICLYKQYRVVSTQKGEVFLYDKDFIFKKKLQGHGASIRQMLQINQYLVTTCLDRYLRVYDEEQELKPLFSLNTKQRPQVFIVKQIDDNVNIEKVEKEQIHWNVQNGKQAKARFEGMRRHTIRLPYLQKMFENHRIKKIIQKKKQQILENKQEVKQEYDGVRRKIFKKKPIRGVQKVKGALLTNKKKNK